MTSAPIDIVIRTYFRDLNWLDLSLASITKFVSGHRRVVVMMPPSTTKRLRRNHFDAYASLVVVECEEFTDDYLGQQLTKLTADQHTDATVITHLDSDCVFATSCDLGAQVTDDHRPIIHVLPHSSRPPGDGWRLCAAEFHGSPLPFNPLTPGPWTYHRDLYASLRDTCLRRHSMTLDAWCLARRPDTLSEFSLLTGQAWFHHRDEYRWVPYDSDGWPCRSFWSRSPHAAELRAEAARLIGL